MVALGVSAERGKAVCFAPFTLFYGSPLLPACPVHVPLPLPSDDKGSPSS